MGQCQKAGCTDCKQDHTKCFAGGGPGDVGTPSGVECPSTSHLVHGQCIACGFSDSTKIVVGREGEYKCASTTDIAFSIGYGQDTREKPRIWTRCFDVQCSDCRADYTKCSACKDKHILRGQQCISCDMSTPTNVLVELDAQYKCVDASTATTPMWFHIASSGLVRSRVAYRVRPTTPSVSDARSGSP